MAHCPENKDSKANLALELAKQTVRFGAVLNLQATWAASLALPWGLGAAGAAATRTFVDAGDVQGESVMTSTTVASCQELPCASPGGNLQPEILRVSQKYQSRGSGLRHSPTSED